MIYLGTLGRMIGVKCPASQRVAQVGEPTFRTTLEGKVKAQVAPLPLLSKRTWDLQMSDATTPDQVADLLGFATGAWGSGPFWFVPADAPYTNLLTPAVASLPMRGGVLSPGGPMALSDGKMSPNSTMNPDPAGQVIQFGLEDSPVIVGQPFTGSAYVAGAGAYVLLQFFDAAGGLVSSHSSATVTSLTVGVRVAVTQVVPAGVAKARISARSCSQATRPATTWTDSAAPWSDGQGCSKAIVHGASRDLVLTGVGRTYSNLSFTVTEVG